jgi:para-aminobenzoate synthetase component I
MTMMTGHKAYTILLKRKYQTKGTLKTSFLMRTIIGKNYYEGVNDELILLDNDNDIFSKLEAFISKHNKKTKLFFISYDLKNKIERLESKNLDNISFPMLHCIIPEIILDKEDFESNNPVENQKLTFDPEFSKEEYLTKINKIKTHIQQGDIYETNFCYKWEAYQKLENGYQLYEKLEKLTKAPFSVYAELNNHIILSASPERFLKRRGNQLISQPIKGTSKRSSNIKADMKLINKLKEDPKERAENIMIVDLVRNDLSKVAINNSVTVEELCEVYTFKNIHQMISTVSCEIDSSTSFSEILKGLFPMGSMTGVPKIRAMELMEYYEESKRGLYSGALGVMLPNGDFDLNVVIRTLVYNKNNNCLSFNVGGAITMESCPEKEYEETLVKAKAILDACK